MKSNNNADIDTSFNSAKLLSIPSQQGEPPTHSTPKRPDISDRRPIFDESSIYTDPESDAAVYSSSNNNKNRKVPKLEAAEMPLPLNRPESAGSAANTISTTTRKNLLGIERNKSLLNFGYVPLGQSLLMRQRIWNFDNEKMHIKCGILDSKEPNSDQFKIVSVSSPLMQPKEFCDIEVQFAPTKVARNVARLIVERINGNSFRYSFTLIGNGGNADLRLDKNFEDGIAFQATSSRAILIRPDVFNRFWLTFENKGQRSAFVFLTATDRCGNILSREVGQDQEQISILPTQFVLDPFPNEKDARDNPENKHILNVLIRVDEAFDWTIDEGDQNLVPSLNSTRRSSRSILSSITSTTSLQSDCAFQIYAYWGEESQRQRLKCWEREFRPYLIRGLRFTGHFQNEYQMSVEQKEQLQKWVRAEDAQDFKDTLRILQFNVIDERARVHFHTEQNPSQPLLNHYRNRSILLKEYCPGEESSLMNGSATMLSSPKRIASPQVVLSKLSRIFDEKKKQTS